MSSHQQKKFAVVSDHWLCNGYFSFRTLAGPKRPSYEDRRTSGAKRAVRAAELQAAKKALLKPGESAAERKLKLEVEELRKKVRSLERSALT